MLAMCTVQGIAVPPLQWPRNGYTFATWLRIGLRPPESPIRGSLPADGVPTAHQPYLYSFTNGQGHGFAAYFENVGGTLRLVLETAGPQGKHDRLDVVRGARPRRKVPVDWCTHPGGSHARSVGA